MLMPNRVKYRRPHRLSYEGRAKAGREITFGEYGLVADEGAYVSSNQLEAARVAMTRYMDRTGKVWIKVFPQLAKTKKPLEVRMGSGKGAPDHWVAVVQKGRVLFEIAGVSEEVAREALRLGANKLCVKTRFVKKGEEAK
jgi:large subunit ribosomal protein L16